MLTDENVISNSWMRKNRNFHSISDTTALVQRWDNAFEKLVQQLKIKWPSDKPFFPSDFAQKVSKSWIDQLMVMYSDTGRMYHTLVHLEEMFAYLDILHFDRSYYESYDSLSKFIDLLRPNHTHIEHNRIMFAKDFAEALDVSLLKTATVFSVFFHDAVYDAKSDSNEEDSVLLFQKFITELTSTQVEWQGSHMVEKMIMLTKSHKIDTVDSSPLDNNFKFYLEAFLDADMSVLGKIPEAYDAYAVMIRQEYIHVPHDTYCEKRAEILESMLGDFVNGTRSKSLYFSEPMKTALEDQAVSNLRREISSLRNYVIPNV